MIRFTQYLICTATLLSFFQTKVQAQRNVDISVTLVTPAENAVIPYNVQITNRATLKNNGPDKLLAGDTIVYTTAISNFQNIQAFTLSAQIDSGASFTTDLDGFSYTGSTDQTFNMCLKIFNPNTSNLTLNGIPVVLSYNDSDTSNNIDCNTVFLKKQGTTAVNTLEPENQAALRPYPNPASSTFRIDVGQNTDGPFDVRLKTINGKILKEMHYERTPADGIALMNISAYANGIYFVELASSERKTIHKLIIQR